MAGVDMGAVFSEGDQVRIKTDPGRVGTVTGKVRERAGDNYWQVAFPEIKQYLPEYEIEVAGGGDEDVYDLIAKGRYGSRGDFRRNMTYIQLSGRLANLVYSMDVTNTDFYAYQYKPVMAFLDSPSDGLLIADEVGLGKTIEAGLIWTEMRARLDARRLLVLCPSMLCEKWKRELDQRFDVRADIMDAKQLLAELSRDRKQVRDGRAIVCSLQGLRPPKGWESTDSERREQVSHRPAAKLAELLRDKAEEEALVDLVIVDESHYLRNEETQSARLGELLRGVTDAMVLLSATPINLRDRDLFNQLRLVDPDYFEHEHSFADVVAANRPLTHARTLVLDQNAGAEEVCECLAEALDHHLLANNAQLAELLGGAINDEVLATPRGRIHVASRIERINLLAHAVTRTRKRDVHELRVTRSPKSHFVLMHPAERIFYDCVTDAVREYALANDINDGFLLAGPQRRMASCMVAALRSWQTHRLARTAEEQYEDFGEDAADEAQPADAHPLTEHVVKRVLPQADLDELYGNDSKYQEFEAVVLDYLRDNPDEKMIVFSYFPGTLEYLRERLTGCGIRGLILHGSIKRSKDEVIAEFRDDPHQQMLFSSEVASEGVDLQFCRVLVNYDLPWNPMKVEQRIGRIDRVGQQAERVSILNMGHKDTIDERVYTRLLERLRIFEQALGGTEDLLGERVKALTKDLFTKVLTPEEEAGRIEQTAKAIEENRRRQDALEKNASSLIAHGDRVLEQINEAHQFKKRVTSEDLQIYVHDYLHEHIVGFVFREVGDDTGTYEIRLPADMRNGMDRFMRQRGLLGQSRLATGDKVRCRFHNRMGPGIRGVETITQFHPLIRYINADLKQRGKAFHPLVAFRVSSADLPQDLPAGVYVFAVQRWSFVGLRQEEFLRARAICVEGSGELDPDVAFDLLNAARVNGNEWEGGRTALAAHAVDEFVDGCENLLQADFDAMAHEKKLDNQDRVNFQINAATRHKSRQLERQKELLMLHRIRGHDRMIPAIEGKIAKIEARFDERERQLKGRAALQYSAFPVCWGAVCIES